MMKELNRLKNLRTRRKPLRKDKSHEAPKRSRSTRASKGNKSTLSRRKRPILADEIAPHVPTCAISVNEILDILSAHKNCCKRSKGVGCLQLAFGDEALGEEFKLKELCESFSQTREAIRMFDNEEWNAYLFSKVKECIKGSYTRKGKETEHYFEFEYKFPGAIYPERLLCRKAYAALNGFTKHAIEECSKALKTNINLTTFPPKDFRENTLHEYTYDATVEMFIQNCGDFDSDSIVAAICPSSEAGLHASIWLEDQFMTYADKTPNSDTRHYSIPHKKDLYKAYRKEMNQLQLPTIHISEFSRIWNTCFPQYRLRPWINVPGKCDVCWDLNERGKNTTSGRVKEALKQCHHMHRGGLFMVERRKYKERVQRALKYPDKIFSCILDGMDQSHSVVPHQAGMTQFSNPLRQHIQGVTLYRTFNNVPKGANLTIYTFLASLQDWIEDRGCFPEEIYLQVDGGSENANKYVLGLLETLIIKRVARVIYYTRLPTGHTHEDIDAVFAHIWRGMRQKSVLTVKQYEEEVMKIFTQKLKCKVKEVYVIPDYKSLLEHCIDKDLKDYTKDGETQHQWRFEAVPETPDRFPLGCKTTYRAYSANQVVEFDRLQPSQCITSVGQLCGMEPRTTYVKWYPDADTFLNRNYEGFYLMKKLPDLDKYSSIQPMKFDANGHDGQLLDEMRNTARDSISEFCQIPEVFQEWMVWMDTYVPDDVSTAEQYIQKLPHLYNEPLRVVFIKDVYFDPEWNTLKNLRTCDVDDFEWPVELIAATRPSVSCQFNKNPPAPRVQASQDPFRTEMISNFDKATVEYYGKYLPDMKNDALYYIHKRRIDHNGKRYEGSQGTNKKTLINYINEVDRDFAFRLHSQLAEENFYSVTRLINKSFPTREELREVVSTIDGTSHSLRNRQLAQFRPNESFDSSILSYFMYLFQARDDRLCLQYEAINKKHQNYVPHGPSKFLTPVDIDDISSWPIVQLHNTERAYIPFQQSLFGTYMWSLLVVDFPQKKIYFTDGINSNVSSPNNSDPHFTDMLNRYSFTVKHWMQNCGFSNINHSEFSCQLFQKERHFYEPLTSELYANSGLVIVIILDFIIHDCPVYFKMGYLDNLRLKYAYKAIIASTAQ